MDRHALDREGKYPMRVVTRLTGLTADTIRVWERRHGAIRPERTSGNARRYSSSDIRRLQLLREAVARGHTIGKIARLSSDEIEALVRAPRDEDEGTSVVSAYLEAVRGYDLRRAHELLTRASVLTDPRDLALRVIAPLLREVGALWETGALTVAQEHMISSQCRAVLGTLIRIDGTSPAAARIVTAAPQGQQHDLGALLGGVLAARRGLGVVHLGPDVPWRELAPAVRGARAQILLLGFARDLEPDEVDHTLRELRRLSREIELWIGCPRGHATARAGGGTRLLHELEGLDAALAARFPGV